MADLLRPRRRTRAIPLAYSPTVRTSRRSPPASANSERNDPRGAANVVQVISTDYWPLPWYLRRLPPVGYWSDVPPAITGNIVITSPDLLPAVQAKLGPGWKMEYFGLRPDVLAVVLSKPAAHE